MTATYKMSIRECTPEFFEKLNTLFGMENAMVELTITTDKLDDTTIPEPLLRRMKNVEKSVGLVRFDAKQWKKFVKAQE